MSLYCSVYCFIYVPSHELVINILWLGMQSSSSILLMSEVPLPLHALAFGFAFASVAFCLRLGRQTFLIFEVHHGDIVIDFV